MTTERRRCEGNFMVLVIMSGTVQVKRVFWPCRSGPSGSKPVLYARLVYAAVNMVTLERTGIPVARSVWSASSLLALSLSVGTLKAGASRSEEHTSELQ